MKKIILVDGIYNFDAYFDYIEKQKNTMAKDLYSFACDWERYSLDSPNSLHDSWLKSIVFVRNNVALNALIDLKLLFLCQFHDRYVELTYLDVIEHNLGELASVLFTSTMPEVLVHEFSVLNTSNRHEILLSGNQQLTIQFQGLQVTDVTL